MDVNTLELVKPAVDFLFGEGKQVIHFLLFMIVLDLITGYMKAFSSKSKMSFKSSLNYVGLMKKLGIIIAVTVAATVDAVSVYLADGQLHIALIFTVAMIIMECLSVVENLEEVGVKVPILTDLLHKMSNSISNKNGEDEEQ
ncbi:phage holin family protein [Listeria monocytogenes]|nr:phage holin family protein [Listeria monocytogenes]